MTAATRDERPGPATWRVAVLYLALTVALTFPLAVRAADSLVGSDPDIDLFMWTLAWDAYAFTHQPLRIFDANIYYPYRHTLAYSENLIGSAFFAAPVLWLTGNHILAVNVVELLSVFLCGLGAYVLGRRLGMSAPAAFLCGLIYAFAPARFFRIAQVHLATVQWIPFCLAYLHAYLDPRQPSSAVSRRRHLWLACAFFSLQALTSGHGAVFLVIASAAVIVYHLIRGAAVAPLHRLRDLSVPGLLLLAPAVLVVIPYRIVQVQMGLRRVPGEPPTWQSFFASPTHLQTFLTSLVPGGEIMERASATLFPGFLTLLAAAAALLPRRVLALRSDLRGPIALYAVLTILTLLLAAGPLWPHVYWLPGLNFIRVPSRFMILTTLCLGVLAGCGADRLFDTARAGRKRVLAVVLAVLFIVEFNALPFRLTAYEIRMPAADRWLNGQPKPFVVAEVPVVLLDRYQTMFMFHSMGHWQRTIHGYSGMRPELHEVLYRQLYTFPDAASLDHLARLGVTYVVVHIDMYRDPGDWQAAEARLAQHSSRLKLEYQDKTSRVYSLR